ncbi:MAG: MBL fold metallo-hydrolase [Bacteroidetes bacterium]|jgi:glyoxylase-like metal-dependent hydrolase (beta-lactamase superfamily II)|nr:MBL fold metallo-hydrolase [Bacteroidota bacterium]
MTIHAIETGKVKVTKHWRIGRGTGVKRLTSTLFGSEFTEWLPIYVWVIEHPEGLTVIDTGIPADANKRIWFPPFMPLVQRAAKFKMTPEQEVGSQLRQLGLSPNDVRWVVLTHLHQDHDGGLHHFPNAEFVVSSKEWDMAVGVKGRMNGYLNQRWPDWFKPRLVDFNSQKPFGPFASHHALTQAEDIHLVPTPGHSPGHLSVILVEDGLSILFAGDASYTEQLLMAQQADGIGPDPHVQQETHRAILDYAEQHPTVYLPSHDPGAKERLENRIPINTNLESEAQTA